MIMGPNGSGKSTILCALSLGFGGLPSVGSCRPACLMAVKESLEAKTAFRIHKKYSPQGCSASLGLFSCRVIGCLPFSGIERSPPTARTTTRAKLLLRLTLLYHLMALRHLQARPPSKSRSSTTSVWLLAFMLIWATRRFTAPGGRLVLQRTFDQENRSTYVINGRKTIKSEIKALCQRLHVFPDNLCQFLPQVAPRSKPSRGRPCRLSSSLSLSALPTSPSSMSTHRLLLCSGQERISMFAQQKPTDLLQISQQTLFPPEVLEAYNSLVHVRFSLLSLQS